MPLKRTRRVVSYSSPMTSRPMPRLRSSGSAPKRKTATVHSRIGYSSERTLAKSGRTKGSWRSIQVKTRSELVQTRAVSGTVSAKWR